MGAAKIKQIRKQAFFDAGNTFCPICFGEWTASDIRVVSNFMPTFEHVPPSSLGGNVVCMTCRTCNSHAGGTSNKHAARRIKGPNVGEFQISGLAHEFASGADCTFAVQPREGEELQILGTWEFVDTQKAPLSSYRDAYLAVVACTNGSFRHLPMHKFWNAVIRQESVEIAKLSVGKSNEITGGIWMIVDPILAFCVAFEHSKDSVMLPILNFSRDLGINNDIQFHRLEHETVPFGEGSVDISNISKGTQFIKFNHGPPVKIEYRNRV